MNDLSNPVVLTLDAGGTNFVFTAIRGGEEVTEPVHLRAETRNIQACLNVIESGFRLVMEQLTEAPAAISFAFPGPADYAHGVIGDLTNLPCFRGGVAMGPYLEEKFGIPVFINNDGNLFAYGEALAGGLLDVNAALSKEGSTRQYHNLVGITLGTGFGCGVVINNVLLTGDNGVGGDVWCMRHPSMPQYIAEEGVSIRAVIRGYKQFAGVEEDGFTPKDIFDIAEGKRSGNQEAAQRSFHELGRVMGATLVNVLNIVDGIVVIGGGIAGASKYILPGAMEEMHRPVASMAGSQFASMQSEVYNWEDEAQQQAFLADGDQFVTVPGSERQTPYIRHRKVAVMTSRLGASLAISLGAYHYAVQQLKN